MKILFSIILLISSFSIYAQVNDSTEIKLLKLKNLLDKNLITVEEFNLLKAKELGIENKPVDLKVRPENEKIKDLNSSIAHTKKIISTDISISVISGLLAVGGGITTFLLKRSGKLEQGGYIGLSVVSIGFGVGSLTTLVDAIYKHRKLQELELEKENELLSK